VRRAGTPLTVAVIDVDHFERVDDEFGHAVPAARCCGTSPPLSSLLAENHVTHTVARWGGEEFLAIVPVALGDGRNRIKREPALL
jgi:diguanylate cyclase (GGDEF)-like protein